MPVSNLPLAVIYDLERHLRPVEGEQTVTMRLTAGQSRVVVVATPPLSEEQMQRVREALTGVTVAPAYLCHLCEQVITDRHIVFSGANGRPSFAYHAECLEKQRREHAALSRTPRTAPALPPSQE